MKLLSYIALLCTHICLTSEIHNIYNLIQTDYVQNKKKSRYHEHTSIPLFSFNQHKIHETSFLQFRKQALILCQTLSTSAWFV